MATDALDQIRDLSKSLSPQDKLRLIGDLVQQLLREMPTPEKKPSRSLWGVLSHLGPAPSAEDIDEARREAWANFPREDI
jgi:hypothetical protein